MSIVLGILIRDNFGNREMIFASDGRAVAHDTQKVRNEEVEKIKKVTPRICMGYAGNSAELFQDVFKELTKRIRKMMAKNLLFVSSKLRTVIIEMEKAEIHREHERVFGPLYHKFFIGGFHNRELRLNTLESTDGFQMKKHELSSKSNIFIDMGVPSQDVLNKVKDIVYERLGHEQSFDEILKNVRYVISKSAERHHGINDHIFIRRLSRNFDLEKYKGYEHIETPESEWKEK